MKTTLIILAALAVLAIIEYIHAVYFSPVCDDNGRAIEPSKWTKMLNRLKGTKNKRS